ncbi:MAG: 2-aminomuconate deaminase [bacterium TMED198]|nr:MAG: 2-aminomuconate deaminase [bacterium TMED198]
MKNKVYSNKAPKPVGSYPHSRIAGDFLFLSGIGPRDPKTNLIPGVQYDDNMNVVSYDIDKQCHSVFSNVKLVLLDSGAIWGDLVDVTVFLTDMKRDFDKFNKIYKEYFLESQPCRTTVEINSLPTPIAIELKCIAFLGDK